MAMMRKCCMYTMSGKCPRCGSAARTAHPPRFSAEDRYGKYRRIARSRMETRDGQN